MKILKPLLHFFIFTPLFAMAQSATPTATTGFFQIFLALAFIIFIMIFGAWILKRIGPLSSNNQINMKVIGGINLSPREKIMVIEVGNQWLVLGVTANQINNLSTLNKNDYPEVDSKSSQVQTQFSTWLKNTIDKKRNSNHSI